MHARTTCQFSRTYLVQLLVVIAIITVLIAILLPVISKARRLVF